MARVLVSAKRLYYKTPVRFRCIFLPAILLLSLIRIIRADIWMIRGEEIRSNQKLAIIYAGSAKNKNYLMKLAFGDSYTENSLGKTCLWNISKAFKDRNRDCSLVVMEVPKAFRMLFERRRCFYVPCWLLGEVDISVTIPFSDSLKTDLRKIRKNNLGFEVTNGQPQFRYFYYNMYLPYISNVYGDQAVLTEYNLMKQKFRNCDLLFVKKQQELIGGILLFYVGNAVHVWSLGVKDGNRHYLKEGVMGALYHFSFCYLREKGYKRVNFGYARTFLNDGVLQYKKKRGLKVLNTFNMGFLIKPVAMTAGVKGFFLNNPFICMNGGGLNGVIFVETDRLVSEKELVRIYKDYYLPGMAKLFVYRIAKGDNGLEEVVPLASSDITRFYR